MLWHDIRPVSDGRYAMNALQTLLETKLFRQIEEKDAEIERLKRDGELSDELMVERAKSFNDMVMAKDAEIELLRIRLEESYAKQTFKGWQRDQKVIAEMADAISECRAFLGELSQDLWKSTPWAIRAAELLRKIPTIQRARQEVQS